MVFISSQTVEVINRMRFSDILAKGQNKEFPDDQNLKCYIKCLMTETGVVSTRLSLSSFKGKIQLLCICIIYFVHKTFQMLALHNFNSVLQFFIILQIDG